MTAVYAATRDAFGQGQKTASYARSAGYNAGSSESNTSETKFKLQILIITRNYRIGGLTAAKQTYSAKIKYK